MPDLPPTGDPAPANPQEGIQALQQQAAGVRRNFFEFYLGCQNGRTVNPLNAVLGVYEKSIGIGMRTGWLHYWRELSRPPALEQDLGADIPGFNTPGDLLRLYRFLVDNRLQGDTLIRRLADVLQPINQIQPELERKLQFRAPRGAP